MSYLLSFNFSFYCAQLTNYEHHRQRGINELTVADVSWTIEHNLKGFSKHISHDFMLGVKINKSWNIPTLLL